MSEYLGEWKDFVFYVGSLVDGPEVCENVRTYFMHDEPLNVYLGWSERSARDHERMALAVLQQGLSFIVRHKITGELAGVHLVMDRRKSLSFGTAAQDNKTSKRFTKIVQCIARVIAEANAVFERDYRCPFYAEIFITSVASKYRGCGLATEMYQRMPPFLKERGFDVIRSTFTSPMTRHIARKVGFKELHRIYFKDQEDEFGEKLFPPAGDGVEEFITDTAIFTEHYRPNAQT